MIGEEHKLQQTCFLPRCMRACGVYGLHVPACLDGTGMCCRQESWSTARASLCPFCQAARESCGMSGEHSSGVC